MQLVYELVALGIDFAAFAGVLVRYWSHTSQTKAIEDAPLYAVSSDLFDQVQERPEHKIPYAVITGYVSPIGRSLKSKAEDLNLWGVLRKTTILEHSTARGAGGFWARRSKAVAENYECVPFSVMGAGVWPAAVEVVDPLSTRFGILTLQQTRRHYEPYQPGFFRSVVNVLSGHHVKGIEEVEEMLANNTKVTAIGELVVSGKQLKLQPPENDNLFCLSRDSLKIVIGQLREKTILLRVSLVVLGGIGIGLLAHLMYKGYVHQKKKWKEEANKQRRLQSRNNESIENLPDQLVCLICAQRPRNVILQSCGHICTCNECAQMLNNMCPVCRCYITDIEPVYIA